MKIKLKKVLRIPEHEIIYYRNKVSYGDIKKARKEMPPKNKWMIAAISILFGILFPYTIEYFYPNWSNLQTALSFLAIFITYFIIAAMRIKFCIPIEWAIGNMGIYLPYFWKRIAKWEDIMKWSKREHGFLIFLHSRFPTVYLVTDDMEKLEGLLKTFVPCQ